MDSIVNFKIKRGFTSTQQLKFIIRFNQEMITLCNTMDENQLSYVHRNRIFEQLLVEFPYLSKVLIKRIHDGKTFDEAVRLTFESTYAEYLMGDKSGAAINSDFAKILLCHKRSLARMNMVCLVGGVLAVIGYTVNSYGLCFAAASMLITSAVLLQPLKKLHTGSQI